MDTDTEKLRQLISNILNLKYPKMALQDVNVFERKLAADLGIEVSVAMALLGFLLTRDYVRIIPDMGLVINPESTAVQALMMSGALNRE